MTLRLLLSNMNGPISCPQQSLLFYHSLTNKIEYRILSNKTDNDTVGVFRFWSVVKISQSHSLKEVCNCWFHFMYGFCRQVLWVQQYGQEQFSLQIWCIVLWINMLDVIKHCAMSCHVGCNAINVFSIVCKSLSHSHMWVSYRVSLYMIWIFCDL